jgi:hypothetical protein
MTCSLFDVNMNVVVRRSTDTTMFRLEMETNRYWYKCSAVNYSGVFLLVVDEVLSEYMALQRMHVSVCVSTTTNVPSCNSLAVVGCKQLYKSSKGIQYIHILDSLISY